MSDFELNMCKLTPAELKILYMLNQGKTSKEISAELNRSEHTIKKHYMSRIYMKLGITGSMGGQGKKAKELRKKLEGVAIEG